MRLTPARKNEVPPRTLVSEMLSHQSRALMHAIEAEHDGSVERKLKHSAMCFVELCGFAASAIALLSILVERVERLERVAPR